MMGSVWDIIDTRNVVVENELRNDEIPLFFQNLTHCNIQLEEYNDKDSESLSPDSRNCYNILWMNFCRSYYRNFRHYQHRASQ